MTSVGSTEQQFWQALNEVSAPELGGQVAAEWVSVEGKQATLTVPFAVTDESLQPLQQHAVLGQWQWQKQIKVAKLRNSQPDLPMTFGNVIVVSSGKGGVGKSSVSVNLALALQQMGAKVGLLDADIYGPSIATMMGGQDSPLEFTENNKMLPKQRWDIAVNSLGYLVQPGDATIWRGPMASGALQQLFNDTRWGSLDYLIVDMPPGTGDVQLTLAQKLPVTGAIVVTTPQTIALADAEKGIAMFNKVSVPLVGIIENMSYFSCPSCGHEEPIFGSEGGLRVAKEHNIPLLGQWPLQRQLRESLDGQQPFIRQHPEHPLAREIFATAQRTARHLYFQRQAESQ
ncbi:iron-sulfur cluster carrier protein ApbC [Idiomarina tyrosinivorans]|uniref:iron-sulfur cluster carrier protein ApbC n=1 Tax=Idiomarina tyrosinivorans TaxID=1445662 RepID=UPI001F5418D2|nr:iron-sulfur cluster carrier protein ApbC [Idiomarina tyrosinivorans]